MTPTAVTHTAKQRRALLLTVLLATVSLGSDRVLAAWEIQPRLNMGSRYDTNPRLSREKETEQDSNGLIADFSLTGSYQTERTSVSLTPRYRYGWYSSNDRSDLEDRDVFISLNGRHRTLRNVFALSSSYSEIGERRNELAASSISNPSDDLNFLSLDRTRWNFNPSWEHQFSERLLLAVSGGYEQVEFERSPQSTSNQFDYDYTSAQVTLQRVLNEKNSIGLSASASFYDADTPSSPVTTQSDSTGLNLVYLHAFSETLSGSLRAGYAKTEIETDTFCPVFFPGTTIIIGFEPCTLKSDSNNFTGEVSLTKQGERTTYDLSLRRSLAPNSRGGEVVSDRVNANLRHRLTKRLDLTLGIAAQQQSNAVDPVEMGAAGRQSDQNFAQVYTDLGWRFTREFSLRASYRFTYIADENSLAQTNDGRNHQVFLQLVYQPTAWRP